jgi:MOSC domain-containing protein YiiM
MTARLLAIYLRPAARLPVRTVTRAVAIAGVGIDGDHARGGRRQITLLAREAWERACADFGAAVPPEVRRANLFVEGIDLGACLGKSLQIGEVVVAVLRENRPCELLDGKDRIGLCAALRAERRAGVYGTITTGGVLEIGAPCRVLA